ncbi:hypothetical protein L6452_22852 [Arctium lappa]|uniref:Uncharacterized protein n=1 Tax=Arctium lappa TaxID=4217 RepID=A0ACB9B0I3_ARCLA|nr:hypothetical protein L6452_22852 [Arctium lappa]
MTLHQTISELTEEQKDAVEEMGLGCFIGMTVDRILSKLGFFVENNLDTNSMQLKLKGSSIIIIRARCRIIKVQIGGLDFSALEQDDKGAELASTWKKQYKKDSPRPTDVMKTILATSDAGESSRTNAENPPQDLPPTADTRRDDEAIKKEFIMEVNEKFGLLMCMNVDAQTIIVKAKERCQDIILEKSGGNTAEDEEAAAKANDRCLPIVPVNEVVDEPVPILECGPNVPIPSYNQGISPPNPIKEPIPLNKGK